MFKHHYLATLHGGMMFGELGILMNKPRTATVVAQTNIQLAAMHSDDYRRILKEAELRNTNNVSNIILFFLKKKKR